MLVQIKEPAKTLLRHYDPHKSQVAFRSSYDRDDDWFEVLDGYLIEAVCIAIGRGGGEVEFTDAYQRMSKKRFQYKEVPAILTI